VFDDFVNQLSSANATRNNASNRSLPVILMSGTAQPITAWINYVGGTSTCNFSTGSCTTSENYSAEFVGGNANQQTYTWQLIGSSIGGFSLSSSDRQATVNLTAGAGTHTTTLRCTISQAGSASVVVDRSITRIHTSGNLVSPMVGASNTSWSSTDTQYEGASASAVCRIWMTNDGQLWIEQNGGSRNGAPTTAWWSGAGYTFGSGVAGIGANYWVRFTRTAFTGSSGNSNGTTGWLSLSTDRNVEVYSQQGGGASGISTNSATYTIEVASTSAGGGPTSTTTGITISASADSINDPEP
jgi:hypothetical protein